MKIWVQLITAKNVEVGGEMKRFKQGDWVEVGKQTAMQWVKEGSASKNWKQPNVLKRRPPKPYDPHNPPYTLFAIPMSFQHRIAIKQDNAIASWMRLDPRPIVMLFGNEVGIAEAAQDHDALHLPAITMNEYGTPVVSEVFKAAESLVEPGDVICYVNCDIILFQDWSYALMDVMEAFDEQFLMIGRRWDIDISHPLEFQDGWERRLLNEIATNGSRRGIGTIDYFAFRVGTYQNIPPFAVGRSAWDNWLVGNVIDRGIPVVEVSEAATIVHQDRLLGEPIMTEQRLREKRINREMYDREFGKVAGNISGTMNESQYVMTADGTIMLRAEV